MCCFLGLQPQKILQSRRMKAAPSFSCPRPGFPAGLEVREQPLEPGFCGLAASRHPGFFTITDTALRRCWCWKETWSAVADWRSSSKSCLIWVNARCMHGRAHPKHSHNCTVTGLPGVAVTLCSTPDEAECHLASGGAKFEVLLSEVRPLALVLACVAFALGTTWNRTAFLNTYGGFSA